jgi:hypothetical protein
MSTPVTVDLSNEVYRQIEKFALLANRDLIFFLTCWLAICR